MTFRVLITASRTWSDPVPIRRDLDALARGGGELVVIHGGASGGDKIASQWVADQRRWAGNRSVCEECHRADWGLHGRRAGILRNVEMVQSGANLCLAYIRDDSKGATHCARTAEAAGIETRIFRWPAVTS